MDIIEFALNMEKDGKAFYEKQAAAAATPELREILLTLAEEEERHFRFFASIKAETPVSAEEFSGQGMLERAQNIFRGLSGNADQKPFGDDVISVWTEALRLEEKAVAFYTEKAAEETDAKRRALLEYIAEEERRHIYMIDGILTYLKQPETFAYSAQFRNFMSLEGR